MPRAGWDRAGSGSAGSRGTTPPGGLVGAPGEGAGKAQVVGEALRASALAEDLGERPGFHGLLRVAVGLQADDLVEALDGLAVLPGPGQAERPVEPGLGVVGDLGGQAAERLRGVGELGGLAVAQHAVPRRPLRSVAGLRKR